VSDRAFRPLTAISAVMTGAAALLFLLLPAVIGPRFAQLFADFGGELPLFTRLALKTATPMIGLLLLGAGTAAAVFRPRERPIILSLTAGAGLVGVLALIGALYLPIFALAGQIK
jgi:type II secretory pathway component PulF